MEPYQQRVVKERDELDTKLIALFTFTQSKQFQQLRETDQELLLEQLGVMRHYLRILDSRLMRFKANAKQDSEAA